MFKRLNIYFKEMYPIIPRFFLAAIIVTEIYFLVALNNGIMDFNIGVQEIVAIYTIFAFLMWLRIADDFKDYETDKKLFKERPLPSGKVKKKDLFIICLIVESIAIILNLIYMNNVIFFVVLYLYGLLMQKWFFEKDKIQKSLILALITHNPVQIFMNIYIVSFVCFKYNIKLLQISTILAVLTLYFPALIWEVSRKIRAPKDENEYETYSKIFGYKKATKFVLTLTIIDIITNILLIYNLNKITVIVLIILVTWMTNIFIKFIKNPEKFKLVDKVEKYTYIQEIIMIITLLICVGK